MAKISKIAVAVGMLGAAWLLIRSKAKKANDPENWQYVKEYGDIVKVEIYGDNKIIHYYHADGTDFWDKYPLRISQIISYAEKHNAEIVRSDMTDKAQKEYDSQQLTDTGISGVVTATGNEKVTIREAHKRRKEFYGYVIFKDIAEPNESQVWCIDYYDPSYKEYVLHNCADTSKEKYVKGDKTCYVGFYY